MPVGSPDVNSVVVVETIATVAVEAVSAGQAHVQLAEAVGQSFTDSPFWPAWNP